MTKGIFDNVCALIAVVCAFCVFPVHTLTIKAICSGSAAVGMPASWVRARSRQALSLSGLCYRRGNSVALIKASFNKGGVCMLRALGDLASPTLYDKEPKCCLDWDFEENKRRWRIVEDNFFSFFLILSPLQAHLKIPLFSHSPHTFSSSTSLISVNQISYSSNELGIKGRQLGRGGAGLGTI